MTCQELYGAYGYWLNLSASYTQLAFQAQMQANDYYMQAMAQGCFSGAMQPPTDEKLQAEMVAAIELAAASFLEGWQAQSKPTN